VSPLPTEVMDLRDKMARWGLRGFWLVAGVAVVVMVGAFIFPKQLDIFLDTSVGLWIAAMLCIAIKDVRRTENPPWWNRMTRLQKTLYLLGALALGLLVAMARH
jgi:hypothetical protein